MSIKLQELQQDLNPAQWKAVSFEEGPLLVIAGAGTGKTKTLIYRVACLLEKGITPSAVLLLTFTRKASHEMLRRAALLLDARCEQIEGGTFHHFAFKMLKRYRQEAHLPSSFTIIDRGDATEIIGLLRHELNLDKLEKRFPRKKTILEAFSKAVNKCVPLTTVLEQYYAHFAHFGKELSFLYHSYQEYKAHHGFFDYDDLLLYFNHILKENPPLAEKISSHFQFILVDEYQDTNKLQAEILCHLCVTHNNIMVVGDDAQGIYSFRGANPKNIFDFPKLFQKTTLIRLEQNYRSTQPILNLANAVMKQAQQKMDKTLFNPAKSQGTSPFLVETADERSQSDFVTSKILELREAGIPLEEMAVLFRSSYHSFDLELDLSKKDIPYQKFGGLKFIETAHIKDILCYLRLLINVKDALALHRTLLLLEGVGPSYVNKAMALIQQGATLEDLPERGKQNRAIVHFKKAFHNLDPHLPPAEALELIFPYYKEICIAHYDNYPKRLKDIEQLIQIASSYKRSEEFLSDLALEPPDASAYALSPEERDPEKLTLSTIHSAKGLEWHTVFIIWALEGRFPSGYAALDPADLEEERRLMYVAITRAKENLFITYPVEIYDRTTGKILSLPSRFIEDVQEPCLEKEYFSFSLPAPL